jgi:hypothetical protein
MDGYGQSQSCGRLNKHLAGKRFAADPDKEQAVTFLQQTLDTDFFNAEYKTWCQRTTNA